MNILEVNFSDIVGRKFNGYDLHLKLNSMGMKAFQIVIDKRSNTDTVIALKKDWMLHQQLRDFEYKYSISNLLCPYGEEIKQTEAFQNANIVHYHILHNGMVSLLDYPGLMNWKKSVWTIHDPWIITGNCVHPLNCMRWMEGCGLCERLDEKYFEMSADNTAFMWKVKKQILAQVNPDIIVASEFMRQYLEKSPLTQHFNKIHKIPFGVDAGRYEIEKRYQYKSKYHIDEEKFVIGFRADDAPVKGCKYLYDALLKIEDRKQIVLVCVGAGSVPDDITEKYGVIQLGWTDNEQQMLEFYEVCDLFVMPSLAESFGLMAIEAMAAGCAILCFKDTVLEEITKAPECGIAVPYQSSEALATAICQLTEKREEVRERGRKGHELVKRQYRFDEYVNRHKTLYEKIILDNEKEDGEGNES